ncbi:MAG: hypothetical protein HC837_20605 [Chloroflexaceae bacterium]|nr:hypothetical protein [Chloroflexaceae bacterium]
MIIAEQQRAAYTVTYSVSHALPLPQAGRRRATSPHVDDKHPLQLAALRTTIRSLWARERSLGAYSPVDELTLELEALPARELRLLKQRIIGRLQRIARDARVADAIPD